MSNLLDDWLDNELYTRRVEAFKLLEKVRLPVIKSNPETLKDFMIGSIHEDYQNEVVSRIENLRDFYEECPNNQYLETRGGIKAFRFALVIFEDILRRKVADLESENKERKDEKII